MTEYNANFDHWTIYVNCICNYADILTMKRLHVEIMLYLRDISKLHVYRHHRLR